MHARIGRIRLVSALALASGLIALIGLPSVLAGPNSATITVHAFWCEAEGDQVTITTTAGQETICDWYYHYER
jgi:hypothetical protein